MSRKLKIEQKAGLCRCGGRHRWRKNAKPPKGITVITETQRCGIANCQRRRILDQGSIYGYFTAVRGETP